MLKLYYNNQFTIRVFNWLTLNLLSPLQINPVKKLMILRNNQELKLPFIHINPHIETLLHIQHFMLDPPVQSSNQYK